MHQRRSPGKPLPPHMHRSCPSLSKVPRGRTSGWQTAGPGLSALGRDAARGRACPLAKPHGPGAVCRGPVAAASQALDALTPPAGIARHVGAPRPPWLVTRSVHAAAAAPLAVGSLFAASESLVATRAFAIDVALLAAAVCDLVLPAHDTVHGTKFLVRLGGALAALVYVAALATGTDGWARAAATIRAPAATRTLGLAGALPTGSAAPTIGAHPAIGGHRTSAIVRARGRATHPAGARAERLGGLTGALTEIGGIAPRSQRACAAGNQCTHDATIVQARHYPTLGAQPLA